MIHQSSTTTKSGHWFTDLLQQQSQQQRHNHNHNNSDPLALHVRSILHHRLRFQTDCWIGEADRRSQLTRQSDSVRGLRDLRRAIVVFVFEAWDFEEEGEADRLCDEMRESWDERKRELWWEKEKAVMKWERVEMRESESCNERKREQWWNERELRWESKREEINKIIINKLQYPCKYTRVL